MSNYRFKRLWRLDLAPPLVAVIIGSVLIMAWRPSSASQGVVEVPYAIATDAVHLITPMIHDFNQAAFTVDGRRIRVIGKAFPSGDAMNVILAPNAEGKPVAWTPGNSLWGRLLNARAPREYVQGQGLPLVQSPQVVAVFKEKAMKLKLTDSEPLADLLELAKTGDLRLAHTDPNVSTSGLASVLSEFYLAANKNGNPLTTTDVASAQEKVRAYEGSIVHYVDIGKTFRKYWCQYGPPFADAAYMQETTFLEVNRGDSKCRQRMVAIYPSDLPLVADYRYIVLDAPWVTPLQHDAATSFGTWLEQRLTSDCDAVSRNGFRKDRCVPRDVNALLPESPPPALPDPQALVDVQRSWGDLRRPAHVMLVVDLSTRMSAELTAVKDALLGDEATGSPIFAACPRHQDQVGMIVTGGEGTTDERVSLGPWDRVADRLREEIERMTVGGQAGATLYDAIDRAAQTPTMLDPNAIDTIIVLSSGVDDGSVTVPGDLASRMTDRMTNHPQILFVPYGGKPASGDAAARFDDLSDIVRESLGRTYDYEWMNVAKVGEFICQFL